MAAMCFWPTDVVLVSQDLTFTSKEEAELACSKLPGCAMYYSTGPGMYNLCGGVACSLYKICPDGSTLYESKSDTLYVIKGILLTRINIPAT